MSSKKVQVLGPGCPKCIKMAEVTQKAINEMELDCTFEKVTDIMEITNAGVLMTPALVVDGEVKIVGKVPSLKEIKIILTAKE